MPDLQSRYQELQRKLNYEAAFFGTVRKWLQHPAYREIVGLGRDVVPIILSGLDRYHQTRDYEDFQGLWVFNALKDILGTGPAPGVLWEFTRTVEDWVRWGETAGFLAPDRPRYEPRAVPKGWVVIGFFRGEEHALCPKRDPKNLLEEQIGTAAWVSKIDASGGKNPDWWKRFAWVLPTRGEAETALEVLKEKIAAGECSEFNRPERSWVEEI